MPTYRLKIKHTLKGRAVSAVQDSVYIGRNYDVYEYKGDPSKLSLFARIPCPLRRKLIEPLRPLCRLFRHEIRGVVITPSGNKVVAPRQGLYYGSSKDLILQPASLPTVRPELRPPTSLTLGLQGCVLWGEYWGNSERRQVRICVSLDGGKSYDVAFSFKPGEIRHIHKIQNDEYNNCYWIFAGDHGSEPGIGCLSSDFKNFQWLVKGLQKYRAVAGFILKERIVYATDSEMEPNGIYALDKISGKTEKLCDTPGSSVFACKFGKWYAISTGVEYFRTFKNNMTTLWISEDTENWHNIFHAPKDNWSIKYFQFGGLVLPSGYTNTNEPVFSGQAVKKWDNIVCITEIVEES